MDTATRVQILDETDCISHRGWVNRIRLFSVIYRIHVAGGGLALFREAVDVFYNSADWVILCIYHIYDF